MLSQLAAVAAKAGSGALIAGLLSFIPGVGGFVELFKSITGFAGGGIIPEPVLGVGLRSGTGYTFGERGPEYVMPPVKKAILFKTRRFPVLAMAA